MASPEPTTDLGMQRDTRAEQARTVAQGAVPRKPCNYRPGQPPAQPLDRHPGPKAQARLASWGVDWQAFPRRQGPLTGPTPRPSAPRCGPIHGRQREKGLVQGSPLPEAAAPPRARQLCHAWPLGTLRRELGLGVLPGPPGSVPSAPRAGAQATPSRSQALGSSCPSRPGTPAIAPGPASLRHRAMRGVGGERFRGLELSGRLSRAQALGAGG